MPHVVTQSCCSDAACVFACPVNCIQPTPDDPGFLAAEMLFIDPETCVDCGACVSACPVGAIKPHQQLAESEQRFRTINAEHFKRNPERAARPVLAPLLSPLVVRRRRAPLRVAIVGSGPAAMYAADEVLTIPGARVDVYERLPAPYGLARFGIAPDHRRTRRLTRRLDQIARQPGLTMHLGIEVGKDVRHDELLASHHAVIYAVGASSDKRLEIPGAELGGIASATEFVAWYNGHPDAAGRSFDLSVERVVVIGNGNVALDVARILTADPGALAGTDIAADALRALRASRVKEVVVTGRRGPEHSAFTLPELIGLEAARDVDLLVAPEDLLQAVGPDAAEDQKLALLRTLPAQGSRSRRIRLRYSMSPTRFVGDSHVESVEFERSGQTEATPAGLVLTSIGYRGVPLADLPFDAPSGTVPNRAGRVVDPATGEPLPGVYVAGWIKRGPTGFIGTNRSCALETVRALVEDWGAGERVECGLRAG
ncbi:MAG: FAD-dependent oxidoreductase [Solirubrobacteraceae bacterium]